MADPSRFWDIVAGWLPPPAIVGGATTSLGALGVALGAIWRFKKGVTDGAAERRKLLAAADAASATRLGNELKECWAETDRLRREVEELETQRRHDVRGTDQQIELVRSLRRRHAALRDAVADGLDALDRHMEVPTETTLARLRQAVTAVRAVLAVPLAPDPVE